MALNLHQATHFVRHFFSAKRRGHGVHSPFAYQLCENVFYNHHHFYDFEKLDVQRQNLLRNNESLEVQDFGAGSKAFAGTMRKVKDIAAKGISSKQQCELLYRLMNFMNCRFSLELGTSLGLNTLYMANVKKNARVISVEGSTALYAFAKQLATDNSVNNIEFINARFDDALPALVNNYNFDLIYIDGNHTYDATLSYFKQLLPATNLNSVFVFDDIYWSPGMTAAWEELKKQPSVTLSVDLFYFGILFFKPELKETVHLKMYI